MNHLPSHNRPRQPGARLRLSRRALAIAAAGFVAATSLTMSSGRVQAEEQSQGPRALFTQADLETIRSVAASDVGSGWASTARTRADAALQRPVATTCQRQLRYDLPDLAMSWLLSGDRRYADKAREVLVGVHDAPAWTPSSTTPGCTTSWGDYGWRWPQLLAQTALAYDWLRGSGALSDADISAVQKDLVDGGEVIYTALTGPEYSDDAGYRNVTNYRLRNDAGLGIVALVLGESGLHEPSGAWAAYAWKDLFGDTGRGTPRYLAQMIASDGVYKEGQGYYQDSFRLLIPYFVAAKNLTGQDAFADPLVHAAFQAPVATAMPDGSPPTIDTGWRSPTVAGGLSHWVAPQYPDEPWHRWQWQREGTPVPATDQPLSLALYRPGPSAQPTGPASRFLRDNAYAVLRSDWSPDASWLLLNAEGVPDRSPHEQPDQTSFSFYAKGAYLAVDPGDGRDCGTAGDRWLRSAPAHNLVLVDGQGPRVTWDYDTVLDPASLDRGADVGSLAQARATMTYQNGVRTTRQTVLAHGDYAVVFDTLRGAGDAAHDYDWRLHLADGGSAPVVSGDRASWSAPRADGTPVELTTVVAAADGASWSLDSGPTNYVSGKCTTHPILQVATHGRDADIVSVLYPRTANEPAPSIHRINTASARGVTVETAAWSDLALARLGSTPIDTAGTKSDAARVFLSRDHAGRPRSALMDDGRQLSLDNRLLLQASAPISATLAWNEGQVLLRAALTASRETTVVIALDGARAGQVELDGRPYHAGSGLSVTVRLGAGEHVLTVRGAEQTAGGR